MLHVGADSIKAYSDSQLVISYHNEGLRNQGWYDGSLSVGSMKQLPGWRIHFPRSENHQTNALSKLASSSADGKPKRIKSETLIERSIEPRKSCGLIGVPRGRILSWHT